MLKLHMFQPQFAETFNVNGKEIVQAWIPYSTGILWAFAQDHEDIKQSYKLEKLHYLRRPLDEVLESMDNPDVAAFSCYKWNENYNLKLAERIKQEWPNCKIIFGGPQTGANHLKYDFIDSRVNGEGEQAFLDLLRSIRDGKELDVITKSIRKKDLTWSSPYLIGVFDDIIKEAPDNYQFETVLETTRGCPYQCTFCDWGELGSKMTKFDLDRIEQEIKWIANNPIITMFFTDSNFGVFKDRDMEIARMLRKHTENSKLEYVAMNFLKNSNERIFEITKELGHLAKSVTLSLQSLNEDTLKAIKRTNMKSNDLEEMLRLSKKYNTATVTDMILGLPMETLQSWKKGMMHLLEMGNDGFIDTHFTNILVNAELAQKQMFEYRIKTVTVEEFHADDWGIPEEVEVVTSTSTMSRDDMVEAFLWNWIIRFFHTTGYTDIVSRYYVKANSGSYFKFYQTLLDHLRQSDGPIEKEFSRIERATKNLLATGKFTEGIRHVYDFYISSYSVMYENIEEVFKIVERVIRHLDIYEETVLDLQKRIIINEKFPPVDNLKVNFDVNSWKKTETHYDITRKIPHFKGTYNEFVVYRRSSKWKNNIIQKPLTSIL